MRIFFPYLFIFILAFIFSNCASIVSKSAWPFTVDSDPAGARVVIVNKKGMEIFRGRTPAVLKLKSGSSFFTKESYVVSLASEGYETRKVNVECKINGWYFGNIIFGGLIGFLIVDPATGAMYRLANEGVSEHLLKSATPAPSLSIINKKDIPSSWVPNLIKIN